MDFKIFEEKELINEVSDPIDLGKLKAGEKKQFIFYVFNSSRNPHDEVDFIVNNKEVKVIFPEGKVDIAEKATQKIILEWEPSVDIRRGLKASLQIDSFEVFKG